MRSIIMRFFRKGINVQKRADIIIDLRKPDSKIIHKWSLSQKLLALAFLEDCDNKFKDFKNDLKKTLNQTN